MESEWAWAIIGLLGATAVLVTWRVAARRHATPTSSETNSPLVPVPGPDRAAQAPEGDADPNALSSRPSELVLGSELLADAISIRLATPDVLSGAEPVPVTSRMRKLLGPIVNVVPALGVAGTTASEASHIVMRFSPELTAALGAGTAELMESANTPGAWRGMARWIDDKKIAGHAELFQQLNPAIVAVALWQVAAVVTAQKYLADINEKLARIEEGVRDVRAFLDAEKLAALEANLQFLKVRAEAIEAGEIEASEAPGLAQHLDSIERESAVIFRTYIKELERLTQELSKGKWDGVWNMDDHRREANETLSKGAKYGQIVGLAAYTRHIALTLRGAITPGAAHVRRASESLADEVRVGRKTYVEFSNGVAHKLETLNAKLRTKATIEKIRNDVYVNLRARKAEVLAGVDSVHEATSRLAALPEPGLFDIVMVLDARGEVAELWRLPKADDKREAITQPK